MASLRLTWFAALSAGVALWASYPKAHAGPTEVGAPVEHRIVVALEPASGELGVAVEIMTPPEDYVFSIEPAEWITVETLEIGRQPVEITDPEAHIEFGWERHMGRHIRVELSGRVPKHSGGSETAGRTPDAVYLFADESWLPEPHPTLNRYWMELSVPEPFRAIAPGNLVLEERDGPISRSVYDFVAVGENPSVFAGEYAVAQRFEGGRRLRTYFFDADPDLSKSYFDAAESYIDRYSDLIGDYPHNGFSIVAAPLPVGLGFSGMTYVSRDILQHPYMRGRSLAHEILHNWWGNAVAIDHETGNWGEGLTTYLADHALAEESGPEVAREMRLDWLLQLAVLPEDDRRALRKFHSASHDRSQAVGYGKSALLFHMLKGELGEDLFNEGLRAFYSEHLHARADWDDIRMAFEEASARDLRWFFDRWLEDPDMPTVELRAASVEKLEDDYLLRLDLSQDRAESRVSLPVRIETDKEVIQKMVSLAGGNETVTILIKVKPTAIAVDPDFETIRRLLPDEAPATIGGVSQPETPVLFLGREGDRDDVLASVETLLRGSTELSKNIADLRAKEVAMVVGSTAFVAEALPDILDGSKPLLDPLVGTSRAWSQRLGTERTILFVSADEVGELPELLAALRYYGNRSFVIKEAGGATDAGVLLPDQSPLMYRFE